MAAQEKTVSLRELRGHVRALDKIITDAWFSSGSPTQISFADLRKHAHAIASMVADDSPRAATATSPPKAADKAPAFDPVILGLYHTRKG
jgi:hypothetical protein